MVSSTALRTAASCAEPPLGAWMKTLSSASLGKWSSERRSALPESPGPTYSLGFLTPTAPPMTKATATNAIQPQIAVLRCCALQRPARAANVLACTRVLLEREVLETWSDVSQGANGSGGRPCGRPASKSGVIPICRSGLIAALVRRPHLVTAQ